MCGRAFQQPPHPPGRTGGLARGVSATAAGLTVLIAFLAVGEWVVSSTSVPFPGSVLGMLLLLATFRVFPRLARRVRPAATLLLRWMPLFFVPPLVSLLAMRDVVRAHGSSLIVAAIAGAIAVLLVVGRTFEAWSTRD